MEIRHHCLTYLQSLKEIHAIELPDESDEFEAEDSARKSRCQDCSISQ